MALAEVLPEDAVEDPDDRLRLREASGMVRRMANGWFDDEPDYRHDPGDYLWIDGMLSPPSELPAAASDNVKMVVDAVRDLASLATGPAVRLVLIVDSLDRLIEPELFRAGIEQDIRFLRALGIGFVIAGPIRVLFGAEREVTQLFDDWQYLGDIDAGAGGTSFLIDVLRRRAGDEILAEDAAAGIAARSGGVMRDLVMLTRSSAQEAYLRGLDQIDRACVAASADAYGRQLLLGLDPRSIEVLKRVKATGVFAPTNDQDIALLATRRLLQYQRKDGTHYAVHPCLSDLLDSVV